MRSEHQRRSHYCLNGHNEANGMAERIDRGLALLNTDTSYPDQHSLYRHPLRRFLVLNGGTREQ